MEEPVSFQKASLLLHHLVNQSLSALDFCILWQEHRDSFPELEEVHGYVENFLLTADLGDLDRALALLPEPREETLPKLEARPPVFTEAWSVKSQRVRDVSRADFCCQSCGWVITLSQEHEANTEMRLPFDNVFCPYCE